MKGIELQLLGQKLREDIRTNLESANDEFPKQKRLIKMIMTLPAATLKDETHQRNAAINTVIAYCNVKEGSIGR